MLTVGPSTHAASEPLDCASAAHDPKAAELDARPFFCKHVDRLNIPSPKQHIYLQLSGLSIFESG